jgi:uncharacterized protein GlcG (DUF336 family)
VLTRRLATAALVLLTGPLLFSQNTPSGSAGGPAQIMTADDVRAVLTIAATALGDDTLAAAVVDRNGAILGVYTRPQTAERSPDIAVTLARTGAMFANDQAPLSSRTVRYISGIHFPPGVKNTPNAALYGVENINRGCKVDVQGDAVFNAPFPRPASIAGTFGEGAAGTPLPCEPSDTRGCARGGPMLDDDGQILASVGITTGRADVFDTGQWGAVPVNPGGVPIYRGGKVVGAVGVAGVKPEFAEYAATAAAAGSGRGLDFSEPLGTPGAVFIDGIRLPFFGTCTSISCIRSTLRSRPPGSAPGLVSNGTFPIQPRGGQQAPEGYLLGPRASTVAGGLNLDEVRGIVEKSIAVALRTRAMIRLPINQPARMTISISDETGSILALYRMPDGTLFSADVAMTKARNAFYFSTREGYEVLRDVAANGSRDRYTWTPEPPAGKGWAITARTISFAGQPLFPPGIDLAEELEERDSEPQHGPWFDLYVYDSKNPCTEGPGASRGGNRQYLNQSGIVWFPGSTPLYRGDRVVGGLGISGDGVEQDDYVSLLGSEGFQPPDNLRVDNSQMVDSKGRKVRLPYVKLPRNPELQK